MSVTSLSWTMEWRVKTLSSQRVEPWSLRGWSKAQNRAEAGKDQVLSAGQDKALHHAKVGLGLSQRAQL